MRVPGREGRNESKTEIRQGLGNSTRPQLFCLPQSCHTQKPGVDGYATSEIAGKILITKFPKFLEETKKERRKEEKKGKSGRKGGREEDPSKQEEKEPALFEDTKAPEIQLWSGNTGS